MNWLQREISNVSASLMPLLMVALLIWFGVFGFTFFVDRRVSALEKRVEDVQRRLQERQTAR
jgi:CcmD family protein